VEKWREELEGMAAIPPPRQQSTDDAATSPNITTTTPNYDVNVIGTNINAKV